MQEVCPAEYVPISVRQDLTQLIADFAVLTHTDGGKNVKQELLQRLQYHGGKMVYGPHALRYMKLE